MGYDAGGRPPAFEAGTETEKYSGRAHRTLATSASHPEATALLLAQCVAACGVNVAPETRPVALLQSEVDLHRYSKHASRNVDSVRCRSQRSIPSPSLFGPSESRRESRRSV